MYHADRGAAVTSESPSSARIGRGTPPREGDGENVLLVVDADGEATIRARLAQDPWPDELLRIESIRPWSVWLRASPAG